VTTLSLQIIHYPHPTLRHVSKPLKRVDAELKQMVAEMFELMYEHEGIGLAANQVDLPYRLFVCNPEGDRRAKDAECVFINPVILKGSGQHEREEGCLSIPGVYAPVVRKEKISVQAYNLAGEEISGELDGLFARVVQHETDHIDGRLFIDRITPTQLADLAGELEEFEIDFNSKRAVGEQPSEAQTIAHIAELERLRT
jgi:peptide deformylase